MPRQRPFIAVYIMASRPFGVPYTGVTSDLIGRAFQHREHRLEGFTKQHNCTMLVWFEGHERVTSAIAREKQIKHWARAKKMQLIEQRNPEWRDLYPWLAGEAPDPRPPFEEDGWVWRHDPPSEE